MINRTFKHLITAIWIFTSFVKILGAGPCQSTGREIRKDLPAMEIVHIYGKFCEVLLKKGIL